MSKCNRCKYEYSSKLDEPCKYCREQMGELSLAYQMHDDKFQPKEEQSTIEHNGFLRLVSFPLYRVEALIAITEYLGFTIEQVYECYCKKNKINYQRLKEWY